MPLEQVFFGYRKIKWLGHTLEHGQVSMQEEKIDVIMRMPVPTKLSELRSFLGLTTYNSDFIPDYMLNRIPTRVLDWKTPIQAWNQPSQLSKIVSWAGPIAEIVPMGNEITESPINASTDYYINKSPSENEMEQHPTSTYCRRYR